MLRGARMVAGDEGVDRLELVDEAIGEQEVERAVDGRRCGCPNGVAGRVVLEHFQQVVSLDRLALPRDPFQTPRADRRQPQAALDAGTLDPRDEAVGVVAVLPGSAERV